MSGEPPAASTAATDTTTTPATAPAATQGGSIVAQNKQERLIVVLGTTVTLCLTVLGIVAALVHRIWIDGNSTLTNDITTKAAIVAGVAVLAMAAALYGQNNVISKMIDKLL